METRYTIAEARDKLPSIVHSVEKGPPVTLTRHGRPVAVLLSLSQYEKLSQGKQGYWEALESFRIRMKTEDARISDTDFEGLRDDSRGRDVELT